MTTGLVQQVRRLTDDATSAFADTDAAASLTQIRAALAEPLRVALAGRVKAGKSTLLNALVGDELAPTDAGECTRIVTWYRDAVTYRVTVHPVEGEPFPARFHRDAGALQVDLAGVPALGVARLDVEWPSSALRSLTLVDTPGIGSITAAASAATERLLTASEHTPAAVDAVIYLMRHVHRDDVRFLQDFHDHDLSHASPVNAVGVLSRADEIGAGRPDAMTSAAGIALRYREDSRIRRLCQTVIPVIGLLAQTAATLRQDEFESIRALSRRPEGDLEDLCRSADRFGAVSDEVGVPAADRRLLLDRLGLFGVRRAVAWARVTPESNARRLAEELMDLSGVVALRDALAGSFAARADLLKARTALTALSSLVLRQDSPAAAPLMREIERIRAGAHEFAEARTLDSLRAGVLRLSPEETDGAERLLGAHGGPVHSRLGVPAGTDPDETTAALLEAADHWRRRAEHPLTPRDVVEAARVLLRTCEGLLAALAPESPPILTDLRSAR